MTTTPAFYRAPSIRTLSDIVAAINDGGTTMTSVAELAGYYAFDAATDALDSDSFVTQLTHRDIDAHLDFLAENGAVFDHSDALSDALSRLAYAVDCIKSDAP